MFASILALGVALPILQTLLPEYLPDATPVLICVGVAAIISPLPVPQLVRVPVWGAAVLLLSPVAITLASPDSVALLALLPVGLLALTSSTVLAALATALVLALTVVLEGGGPMLERQATSWTSTADVLGTLVVLGWSVATVVTAVRTHRFGETSRNQAETARALDSAIARDVNSLETIATIIADPSLGGPIEGAGLGKDHLGLATRITNRKVLLGWLDGSPLATLSAGWALTALARSGQRCPRELMGFARERLDEMLPNGAFRWLAIWDRATGDLSVSPLSSSESRMRLRLTPKGPRRQTDEAPTETAAEVVAARMPQLPDFERAPGAGSSTWIGAGIALAVALACFVELPATAGLPMAALLFAGHALVHGRRSRQATGVDAADGQLQERAEALDDLRFGVGRLHAGLLQYQVQFGDCHATAHRLKGEVLEGSFADLVLDPAGNGHVLAGEVAGRGIAARFLGLAAQMVATHNVRSGRLEPEELLPTVQRRLGPLSKDLAFPCRLRLGGVRVDPGGTCEGWGIINRIVAVRGIADQENPTPLASGELAATVATATLDNDTRVYLSPSAAIPGPEDSAPALDRFAAADRLAEVVRRGLWNPREATLPSLFSVVFDGANAPAHGTLVELRFGTPEATTNEPAAAA